MDWRYPGTLLTLDDWTNQVEWFFRGFRRSRLQWVNGLFFSFPFQSVADRGRRT